MMKTPYHTAKTALEVISRMADEPGELAKIVKAVTDVAERMADNDPDFDDALDLDALENLAVALDAAEERLIIAEGVEQARHARIDASAIRQEQVA